VFDEGLLVQRRPCLGHWSCPAVSDGWRPVKGEGNCEAASLCLEDSSQCYVFRWWINRLARLHRRHFSWIQYGFGVWNTI